MIRALLACALLLLVPRALAQEAPAADPYDPARAIIGDIGRIVTPNGVQETFEVTLGGARQMIDVRGADRGNPILLFIHGGPGAVEMPIAWAFQRPWEDYFTVVQWDQRGAGRSYPLNPPEALAATLNPTRYQDDAIELIELLKRRYGKRKIILLGHSWGSVIGMGVAVRRPDLLYAYIGVGQVIDFRENERQGYAWTLARARTDGNAEAVRALEALAPYPGPGAFDLTKLTIERKWSIHYGALSAGRGDASQYFNAAQLSPLYKQADLDAWNAGSGFTMKTMFPQLSDISFANVHKLGVPVFLALGRHDYTTPAPIAARWLERIEAPAKRALWFEHSAHLPFFEEPGRFFAALLQVRPLAVGRAASGAR